MFFWFQKKKKLWKICHHTYFSMFSVCFGGEEEITITNAHSWSGLLVSFRGLISVENVGLWPSGLVSLKYGSNLKAAIFLIFFLKKKDCLGKGHLYFHILGLRSPKFE